MAKMRSRQWRSSRGITGLETAILLIALAALSTGLFSSNKSGETVRSGMSESRGALEVRGSVIAKAITTGVSGIVDELTFQVANTAGGEPVNLNPGETIIKFTDGFQTHLADTTSEYRVTAVGNADNDNLVEEGEMYEITLLSLAANLSPELSAGDLFTVEVIPPHGAVVVLERTAPAFLEVYNRLD